jgi:hypothetical protein
LEDLCAKFGRAKTVEGICQPFPALHDWQHRPILHWPASPRSQSSLGRQGGDEWVHCNETPS